MPRIRTIKPEFWQHEELSELPAETHILAAALLNHADDEGYFKANPKLVEAACFPLRDLSVSVHDMLSDLSNIGYVTLMDGSDGKRYGRIEKFAEHQRVNRPSPSKIAGLVGITDNSVNIQGSLTGGKERKGKEGKGREQGEKRFAFSGKVIRLTEEDFAAWEKAYRNLDLTAELQSLDDYYSQNGITTKWFQRCSSALAKKNREQVPVNEAAEIAQIRREGGLA